MLQFNNVKILETDLERKYFTKHRLHLNSSGKECIAIRLATVVKSFFHVERKSPIYLQWKGDTMITDQNRNKDYPASSNKDESTAQSHLPHSPKISSTNEDTIESEPNSCSLSIRNEENRSNRTKKSPPYQKR
jgi:hypothetical protein